MHDLLIEGRFLIQMQTEFLKMCAGGALCARSTSYFRRRRKTTEECSQLTDSTLSVAHHGLSSLLEPNASTKRSFFLSLLLCNTLLPKARYTHNIWYFCHEWKNAEERSQLIDSTPRVANHGLLAQLCPRCIYKTNICYLYFLLEDT